jgi:competence protein ComEA
MKKLMVIFFVVVSLACATTPLLAAQAATAPAVSKETPAVAAPINVNTASAAELEKLPGIGKKSAAAIVAYRSEKGPFKTSKDLVKVKGIGEKTVEKIKNSITFE